MTQLNDRSNKVTSQRSKLNPIPVPSNFSILTALKCHFKRWQSSRRSISALLSSTPPLRPLCGHERNSPFSRWKNLAVQGGRDFPQSRCVRTELPAVQFSSFDDSRKAKSIKHRWRQPPNPSSLSLSIFQLGPFRPPAVSISSPFLSLTFSLSLSLSLSFLFLLRS